MCTSKRRWHKVPDDDDHGHPSRELGATCAQESTQVHISGSLAARAQKQLEYYFSDENLKKDQFLLARVGPRGNGAINIADFRNFKRLIVMAADLIDLCIDDLVLAGATQSSLLQISEDRLSIRRRHPLPAPASRSTKDQTDFVSGQIPNLYWCAVPYDELRCQSRFVPLPPVSEVELQGPGTWHWVRQDDALWEELHWGVLTARHLRGILGFDEPQSAAYFKLPKHMVSHSSALHVQRHLQDARKAFAENPWLHCDRACTQNQSIRQQWITRCHRQALISGARADLKRRQRSLRARGRDELPKVQCRWGNVHEATALKIFLDSLPPPCASLEEIGLAIIDTETLTTLVPQHDIPQRKRWAGSRVSHQLAGMSSIDFGANLPPLMGASPDAMLRFDDGSRAAVEVKNVCPFFQDGENFSVCCGLPDDQKVPSGKFRGPATSIRPNQLPQIQWEMLATGVSSNYLISASACHGLNVFIVQRDEAYLQLMLRLISEFFVEFVSTRCAPPTDFFWGRPHYHEFLDLTLAICARTVVAHKLPGMCDVQKEAPFLDHASA